VKLKLEEEMETYLPLIGLIAWAVASLAVAYALDHAQRASRAVPVIRPWYESRNKSRRHRGW
jgi:hypothetical protein